MSVPARLPGLALMLAGLACMAEARTFDVGFLTDPVGPKALPFLAGALLFLSGIDATARPYAEARWPGRPALMRAAGATVAFLVYAALLPYLGFFTSTTLVVAALSLLFGAEARRAVPAAAALAGGLWLLFVLGLGLPLPIGELWIL